MPYFIGLDFGSTTSSAVVAHGRLLQNCVTGKAEYGELAIVYASPLSETPLLGEDLDERRIAALLDNWLSAAEIRPQNIASGGVIVTGLAALRRNANALQRLVRERIGESLFSTVGDPRLESWVAFMGRSAAQSREQPERAFLNLDIGGGTTNIARGLAGEVTHTGSYYIGARHIQFTPGSFRLRTISSVGKALCARLGIEAALGEILGEDARRSLVDAYVGALESLVTDPGQAPSHPLLRLLEDAIFDAPSADPAVSITLSGGVAEIIAQVADGHPWPEETEFADLGVALAKRIAASPILGQRAQPGLSVSYGRATALGLVLHATEVSGQTIFRSARASFPLPALPIVGSVKCGSEEADLEGLFRLAGEKGEGICVWVEGFAADPAKLRAFGEGVARVLAAGALLETTLLVLLVPNNIGKTLGHYATRWGKLPAKLVVLDEVPRREADYVCLGRPVDGIVPVSFFGLRSALTRPRPIHEFTSS